MIDLFIVLCFGVALIEVGTFFGKRLKTSADQFLAGGQCPWWVSGLSAYMTMFSAGTFVVWGGIAYTQGLVAVSINMCYAIAAFAIGFWIAGRWKRLGYASAAEFIEARFGQSVVQFYVWSNVTVMMFALGAMVYALAVTIAAITPLPPDHLLADPDTGQLSVPIISVFVVALVVGYTAMGGLWAVLMTDVFQFLVLTVAVIFLVPLTLSHIGGVQGFVEGMPDGFMNPVSDRYGWVFLAGWVIVNFFKMGAEWSFVQRYLCVPRESDAKKVAVLFGLLYLTTPFFWMLPPMMFRVIKPDVNPEQAYILVCAEVLPVGMVGMMIAAMFSASASSLSSILNVNASAMVDEIYRKWISPQATEKQLVRAGRIATVILGLEVLAGAIIIPAYGSITNFIISFMMLVASAMLFPTIWGLFSRKIGAESIAIVIPVSILVGFTGKWGLQADGFLTEIALFKPLVNQYQANPMRTEMLMGLGIPCLLLILLELVIQRPAPGAKALEHAMSRVEESSSATPSALILPQQMVGFCLACISLVMFLLIAFNPDHVSALLTAGTILALISLAIFYLAARQLQSRNEPESQPVQ